MVAIRQLVCSIAAGAAAGWVVFAHVVNLTVLPRTTAEWICGGGALALALVAGWVWRRALEPRLADWRTWSRRWWYAAGLAAGGLLVLATPITMPPNPLARDQALSITAIEQHNPKSGGREVWLLEARLDGRKIPPEQIEHGTKWEIRRGALLSSRARPASLAWHGRCDRQLLLRFLMHPWSGEAEIVWNGQRQHVDLYHPSQSVREVVLTAEPPGILARLLGGIGLVMAHVFVFGIALVMLGTFLATRYVPEARPTQRYEWAWFAVTLATVWGGLLATYWPGLLSPDSLEQWHEMVTWKLADAHPVFHTLTNWLLTRLWLSPAVVAGAQLIVMALVCGWGLHRLRRLGLPRWLGWTVCLLIVALPANGITVITLWKDVPYSICFLALCVLLTEIVASRAVALRGWGTAILLGILAALITLYRHNGAPAAFGTLLLLAIAYRRHWTRTALALVLAGGLVFAFRVPMLQKLNVSDKGVATWWGSPLVHLIAAHVNYGTPLTADDRAILEQIRPPGPWPYDPYYSTTLSRDGRLDSAFILAHREDEARLLWRLTCRRPVTTLRRIAQRAALVWRIRQPPQSCYYCTALESQNEPRVQKRAGEFGIAASDPWPAWRERCTDLVRATLGNWDAVLWRAALPMYVLLCGCLVATIRARRRDFLLIAAPVLLHSVVVGLVAPGQDFRYQYPVYVTGLLLGPYLLWSAGASRRPSQPEPPGASSTQAHS